MAGSVFATAGIPRARFSGLPRTNGTRFSAAHETENSTVSAGSDHTRPRVSVRFLIAVVQHYEAEAPPNSGASASLVTPSPPAMLLSVGRRPPPIRQICRKGRRLGTRRWPAGYSTFVPRPRCLIGEQPGPIDRGRVISQPMLDRLETADQNPESPPLQHVAGADLQRPPRQRRLRGRGHPADVARPAGLKSIPSICNSPPGPSA